MAGSAFCGRSNSEAWRKLWKQARAAHSWCSVCGSTQDLTVDHIVPIARGGSPLPSAVRVLRRSCNSRKGKGAGSQCGELPNYPAPAFREAHVVDRRGVRCGAIGAHPRIGSGCSPGTTVNIIPCREKRIRLAGAHTITEGCLYVTRRGVPPLSPMVMIPTGLEKASSRLVGDQAIE
jgi:hypothetical protein